ncbi:transcription elongation factor SPT4 [Kwoniella sp. B9012]|uniref:Transcription elongation factor SPT4 n=2 Tax=Kwoniella TaxID=490731 RepID=A0A1B9J068_9TREE|nr:transcription elongation factor SPT4 [Kwoniella mangroviensis CBS 8507]OCF61176.1 transcription elongation factor SPT4 [Kwoniella mangroviensis CBS 10435]OCF66774.1 transcription elongation factor SPT4 [Kwoniella mangroviensis CBS 8507]OCF77194.1 transcription elongation factor SPT4 [Kwoniella mangroviensis CBS 8886]
MPPKGGSRKTELRACLICSVLQSTNDFLTQGCPNCEEILEMRGSAERVAECTSVTYDGMIAMMEPSESWVARWQRIDKKMRGIYAVRVTGRPPQDVIDAIEARGGVYRPRDAVED